MLVSAPCLIIIDSEAEHQVSSIPCILINKLSLTVKLNTRVSFAPPGFVSLIGYEPCAKIAQNRPPLLLITSGNSWTTQTIFPNPYCITLNSLVQYLAKRPPILPKKFPHSSRGLQTRLIRSQQSFNQLSQLLHFSQPLLLPYTPLWPNIGFPLPRILPLPRIRSRTLQIA
jgi:hypothetical protein